MNAVGAKFSEPIHTGPEVHPAFCTVGTGSLFRELRWPKRRADHSPPSGAGVENGYSYTSASFLYLLGVLRDMDSFLFVRRSGMLLIYVIYRIACTWAVI